MTRFCTQCGTPADDDARFCEECGAPFKPVARADAVQLATTPLATTGRKGKRRRVVAGAAVAAVMVGGGLAAYLLADEQASPQVFSKAIEQYYATSPAAAAKLLCIGGLQLNGEPVVLSSFESGRRGLMDELVSAGLYQPPVVQGGGGFMSLETYRYRRTEAGTRAVQNGRLCVAPALQVKTVQLGHGQSATQQAALFRYQFKQPEAWLTGNLAARAAHALSLDEDHAAVMALRDGKWIMTTDDAGVAKALAAGRGVAAPQPSLLQRVKGWFRTGNPLIGKWRITTVTWLRNGVISFAADQASVGRPNEPVTYEVKGDTVTVRYTERNASDVFTIQDDDHISILAGNDSLLLERVKE